MLSSILSPLGSLVSGGASLAQPLLGAALGAPKALLAAASDPVKSAFAAADPLLGSAGGALLGRASVARPRSVAAGYARAAATATTTTKTTTKTTATKTASTAASAKPGPLAFLDDPKLSVEDKLMRLLAYLNDKWEKDLQKKMKDLGAKQGAAGTPSSSGGSTTKKSSSGGLLGGIVKAATSFFPQVGVALEVLRMPAAREVLGKIGGPVLAAAATAMGFPQLAPLALQHGGKLVDLAAGVATSLEADSATRATSTASGSSSTATKSDGAGLSSDREAQLKLMEIQRIIDQQKEMFSLVSNMLRGTHEGRMAVIQNVR
jgi:hypothetical protein